MKNNSRKRIAFFGIKGLPSKGGAERVVEKIINNLNDVFDISIYCSYSYTKDYKRDDINLIKLKTLKGKHLSSFSLFSLSAFHALFLRNFDLAHIHNTDAGFIIPLLKIKYKAIATSHGYPYKREKWNKASKILLKLSENIFFRYSNFITCVSKTIAKELNSKYNKKIHFIPNGINEPNHTQDNSIFNKFELNKNEYICFAAGRIDPTKGCHILLKAINNINRNVNTVVIGDFSHKLDYSKKLYQMANDKVKFIPFIENKEILFGIIKKAKLFIFPSTVEAMSVMLLEVAALGVPIICSDIPENVCVLEDNTIYFKSEDEDDLSEKILFCLANYEDILEKAEKTKNWILNQYKWETILEGYRNIYNSILHSN